MSTQEAEEFVNELKHFGVKGMRWGVRKSEATAGQRGKLKRTATKAGVALGAGQKVIDKGEKELIFLPQAYRNKAANGTRVRVLAEAADINRDPRFKGKDLKKSPQLRNSYAREVEKRSAGIYKEELGIARTKAWTDTIEAIMSPDYDYVSYRTRNARVRHADDDSDVLLKLLLTNDETGHITDIRIDPKSLKHLDEDAEEFLAHYGVKGMRWGVRKDRSPVEVTAKQAKPGTFVKTKGGQNLNAHEDAVRSAVGRQKIKASTTDALSNKELQAVVNRMNLEQQYNRLAFESDRRSTAARFIAGFMGKKRYDGEKRKFTDTNETMGESARKLVDDIRKKKTSD